MVRARPGPVRRHDRALPRLPQARAVPVRDRRRCRCCCWCCHESLASATRSTAPTSASTSRACSCSSRPSSRRSGLVVFLASYLRDTRQVMVMGARRFLGLTIPPLKHFGPVLVIWGIAMVILLLLHDIGSSLMFYGAPAGDAVRGHQPGLVRDRRAGRFRDRSVVPRHAHPARRRPRRGLAASVQPGSSTTRSAAASSSRTRCSRRPPAACSARDSGSAMLTVPGTHPAAYLLPAPPTRHDLRGDHRRARTVRRVRRAAHLPAARRARVQDRDARPRLVLEAAGDRTAARSSRSRCS